MVNTHLHHLRRLMMLMVYMLVADVAAVSVLRPETGLLGIFWSPALGIVATLWCIYDAQARGRPLVTSVHALIFFTWFISVPVYLLKSRKFRGFLVLLGHLAGMAVVSSLITGLAVSLLAYQGDSALSAGDYDRAVHAYSRLTLARGYDPDFWWRLGIAYQEKGQLAEAIEAYEQTLRIVPDFTDCQAALLLCQACEVHRQGDPETAVGLYQDALAIDDSDALVWYNLSVAYSDIGDHPSAIAACERACVLAPDEAVYRSALTDLKRRAVTKPR